MEQHSRSTFDLSSLQPPSHHCHHPSRPSKTITTRKRRTIIRRNKRCAAMEMLHLSMLKYTKQTHHLSSTHLPSQCASISISVIINILSLTHAMPSPRMQVMLQVLHQHHAKRSRKSRSLAVQTSVSRIIGLSSVWPSARPFLRRPPLTMPR